MPAKHVVEFILANGQSVFVEVEDTEETARQRVSRGDRGPEQSGKRFLDAIAQVKPAAEAVLNAFRELNTPDEIGLEFGIKFSASAGAILASVDSEATFKVALKWKNPK
jgi:hypothetical protein